jgi:hypothetical protein
MFEAREWDERRAMARSMNVGMRMGSETTTS